INVSGRKALCDVQLTDLVSSSSSHHFSSFLLKIEAGDTFPRNRLTILRKLNRSKIAWPGLTTELAILKSSHCSLITLFSLSVHRARRPFLPLLLLPALHHRRSPASLHFEESNPAFRVENRAIRQLSWK